MAPGGLGPAGPAPVQSAYGQRWGEGAARCFRIETELETGNHGVRLATISECFVCPITAAVMVDPVATVDGCMYEREYIERWFRERQRQRQTVTSPATGLELPSRMLMPLFTLQKAIEAFMTHRPELQKVRLESKALEETVHTLQQSLLEIEFARASDQKEVTSLRTRVRHLEASERENAMLWKEVGTLQSAMEGQTMLYENERIKARAFESRAQGDRTRCDALTSHVQKLEAQLLEAKGVISRDRVPETSSAELVARVQALEFQFQSERSMGGAAGHRRGVEASLPMPHGPPTLIGRRPTFHGQPGSERERKRSESPAFNVCRIESCSTLDFQRQPFGVQRSESSQSLDALPVGDVQRRASMISSGAGRVLAGGPECQTARAEGQVAQLDYMEASTAQFERSGCSTARTGEGVGEHMYNTRMARTDPMLHSAQSFRMHERSISPGSQIVVPATGQEASLGQAQISARSDYQSRSREAKLKCYGQNVKLGCHGTRSGCHGWKGRRSL